MQICYRVGYSATSSSYRLERSHSHLHGASSQGHEYTDVGRGLQGVVVGRAEGEQVKRSQRDVACRDFLAFVGSRVSLLQVQPHCLSEPMSALLYLKARLYV